MQRKVPIRSRTEGVVPVTTTRTIARQLWLVLALLVMMFITLVKAQPAQAEAVPKARLTIVKAVTSPDNSTVRVKFRLTNLCSNDLDVWDTNADTLNSDTLWGRYRPNSSTVGTGTYRFVNGKAVVRIWASCDGSDSNGGVRPLKLVVFQPKPQPTASPSSTAPAGPPAVTASAAPTTPAPRTVTQHVPGPVRTVYAAIPDSDAHDTANFLWFVLIVLAIAALFVGFLWLVFRWFLWGALAVLAFLYVVAWITNPLEPVTLVLIVLTLGVILAIVMKGWNRGHEWRLNQRTQRVQQRR